MGQKLVVMDIVGVSQFRQALPRQWLSHHLMYIKQLPIDQLQGQISLVGFSPSFDPRPARRTEQHLVA